MTHLRERYLMPILQAKIKFNPIVAIQGPRQCGKSYLVKKLLAERLPRSVYRTFDKAQERNFATTNPDSYIAQFEDNKPIIIDEAQKVPDIFDAIKYSVDESRIPGKFIILGSTEFSKLSLIRESLTGRMSKTRLYPFTLSESRHLGFDRINYKQSLNSHPKVNRKELLRFLERGGFPGIFTVNNQDQREALLKDWIELTIERDIHTFPKVKANSDLALKIIEGIARLEHPDLSTLTKYCGHDSRMVAKHLEILTTLFVVVALNPFPHGTGKTSYHLCDVSLVYALGGDFAKRLKTFILLELLAKNSYADQKRRYYYYRNSKGSLIDFIEEDKGKITALKVLVNENFDLRDFALLLALREKLPHINTMALGASRLELKKEKILVEPWESVA